ncbi:F0F1 ATP synthase subunit delta [Candidatus Uhrbacteria bacterium]|nr:F0F1 ATP synthase subunit delta [Candidatus Uhrbacteria bacterium]
MKLSPRRYAELLFEITRDKSRAEIDSAANALARLLIRHRVTALLPRIIAAYGEIWDVSEGVQKITVSASRPLSGALRAVIFKTYQPKKVEIKEQIIPELVGGVQIQVGDRVIDGSVRGMMEALRKRLISEF